MYWPDSLDLRHWQTEAVARYHALARKNFVADITPGAGKTIFALAVAHDLIRDGQVRRVIVVSHTDYIRSQWQQEAARFGLALDVDHRTGWGRRRGLSVTYQQIAADPAALRTLVTDSQRVFVIFDEIHHVADNATWGAAVGVAFEQPRRRLLLTGTPFRHDESRIRFVTYRQRRAVVDFTYSYADGLRDGIVAPVFFPTLQGEVRWRRGEREQVASLDGAGSQAARADRLNTALDPRNQWLRTAIQHADARLTELRAGGHPEAGGLIVCRDQAHAEAVARLLARLTSHKPIVAISDYADASARIEAFRRGAERWLVAVRMVSEGVDIARLRVGLYATNITTELFFRQLVGRLVRVMVGLADQSAFLYIPADPLLVGYARDLHRERVHVLPDVPTSLAPGVARTASGVALPELEALAASGVLGDVLAGTETFTQAELDEARRVKLASGLISLPDEVVARLLRAARQQAPQE